MDFRTLLIYCLAASSDADGGKFEYIYKKYRALAYKLAFDILRDPMSAEDAVSETFIRVYKNLRKIKDEDSNMTAGFIAVITKNCAKTTAKKNGALLTAGLTYEPEDEFDLEEKARVDLTAGEICRAADKLNEELRAAFLLKYAYDMSNREIAAALGITPNNAGVLAHRAKNKIIKTLTEQSLV